jgi:hypothetical protein
MAAHINTDLHSLVGQVLSSYSANEALMEQVDLLCMFSVLQFVTLVLSSYFANKAPIEQAELLKSQLATTFTTIKD